MEVIGGSLHPIKAWIDGVECDDATRQQLRNSASLPFIHSHIAAMPDVHVGKGATVGSVIATNGAIVPAAVGVDIGCGMIAQRTSLRDCDLPDDLRAIRSTIERTVPVGFALHQRVPPCVDVAWTKLAQRYDEILEKHPPIRVKTARESLGTLGGGNHFCELTIDGEGYVWVMLHSGSRGPGNRIGTYFIERARNEMERLGLVAIDRDLAYLTENTAPFALCRRGRLGARVRDRQPREHARARVGRLAASSQRAAELHAHGAGGRVPPQFRRSRTALRWRRVRDAEGCRAGRCR